VPQPEEGELPEPERIGGEPEPVRSEAA
jgi:hypothetical protein